MKWSYDCSNFGYSGNFIVDPSGGTNFEIGPNELGLSGSGTDHYTDTGTFSLSIISECNWTITVSGPPPPPPPFFSLRRGSATDISVGANGSVWAVGTNPVGGGFGIYHWTGSGWTSVRAAR